MMKKVMGLFIFALLISCQEAKIAYVDYPTLLDGYERKKDVEANYQYQAEAYTRRRDSISQVFQLQAQELQTQTASMSQQAAQEQMNALQQRAQLIGQQLQQEEAQMQRMGQMKSDSIRTKVEETIADYAKKNGYAYILASGEGSSVLYGEDARNITETILEILNEDYKK